MFFFTLFVSLSSATPLTSSPLPPLSPPYLPSPALSRPLPPSPAFDPGEAVLSSLRAYQERQIPGGSAPSQLQRSRQRRLARPLCPQSAARPRPPGRPAGTARLAPRLPEAPRGSAGQNPPPIYILNHLPEASTRRESRQ